MLASLTLAVCGADLRSAGSGILRMPGDVTRLAFGELEAGGLRTGRPEVCPTSQDDLFPDVGVEAVRKFEIHIEPKNRKN